MSASLTDHIDPHFHCWDVSTSSTSGHVHGIIKLDKYGPAEYAEELRSGNVNLIGSVHVEALSDKPLDEAQWVQGLIDSGEGATCGLQAIVAYTNLSDGEAPAQLAALSHLRSVRGIRQILNHHPTDPTRTWPKVPHGSLMTKKAGADPAFRRGFAELQRYGFSFDLQLNPHQMAEASEFLSDFPSIPIVIDHLGCLRLRKEDDTDSSIAIWRDGMQRLAHLPQVNVKLSMLNYTKQGWPTQSAEDRTLVHALVKETITLFGPERCMFASNLPVDRLAGTRAVDIYTEFREIAKDLPRTNQEQLFVMTAAKFYRLRSI